MQKTVAGILAALFALGLMTSAGSTQSDPNVLIIELTGFLNGAEGDIIEVYNEPIPAGLVGASCIATATTANNSSIHPGNDVLIQDVNGVSRIENVEENPGQVLSGSAPVVLPSSNLIISVQLGPSGLSSGGVSLELDCEPAVAPTTTTTTQPATTSTTAAAPESGVDTGAGGLSANQQRNSGTAFALVGLAAAAGAAAIVGLSRRRL